MRNPSKTVFVAASENAVGGGSRSGHNHVEWTQAPGPDTQQLPHFHRIARYKTREDPAS